jgi:saccharopine dehydrogenase-like NADP-dependent oxidoreductase
MTKRKVLILGGYGSFGRHISAELAGRNDALLILAGRNATRGEAAARAIGADFVQCDAGNAKSLASAVANAWLVINAAGPFQGQDYAIPQAAIDAGCHYIDLADGRDYVVSFAELDAAARVRGVFACTGASTTPAVTSALVADLQPQLGPIRTIRIALNAGNKNQPGLSTIAAILSYVGQPMPVWQNGQWQTKTGWTAGETVEFPSPVGRRRGQLCDVPDLSLFPLRFHADTVTFKAGVELTVLNYAIGALGMLKRLLPFISLPSLARPLIAASGLFKPFGSLRGGCGVWVTDVDGNERSAAVVAHENGPRIPGSPAILLARKLLAGEINERGAFPCMGFIRLAEFAEFLAPFHIEIVRGENGVWKSPCPTAPCPTSH